MLRALALPLLASLLPLSGCITFRTVNDGIVRARIGETVTVGPHRVTPRVVLEDSRCPAGVQCAWAGRVRIATLVDEAPRELTQGQPLPMDAGALTLIEVYPQARNDTTYYPDEYRLGFSWRR